MTAGAPATWTADGHSGNALHFDGNDEVDLGLSQFGIQTNGAFTVSFWFRSDNGAPGYLIRRGLYG